MMKIFHRSISFLFHPLLVPITGTAIYFLLTPKYTPIETILGNILPIFILTVVIPIIFYLILRNLGIVSSFFSPTLKEHKYTLYIIISLLLMVNYKVIPQYYTNELFHFFLGLIAACCTCLFLLFLKFKTSIHLMGMGSLLVFLVGISIHFEMNVILALSALTFATGLLASSRLYLGSHNRGELLVGLLIGLMSQLMTLRFWL
ncbi:MAG: hypothetical protein V7724_08320 [Sediminicola sp.]|tara:strand:- start:50063 stop:50671 length:609 start_codon:yes stop_codon:yes gene_type:complete